MDLFEDENSYDRGSRHDRGRYARGAQKGRTIRVQTSAASPLMKARQRFDIYGDVVFSVTSQAAGGFLPAQGERGLGRSELDILLQSRDNDSPRPPPPSSCSFRYLRYRYCFYIGISS